MDTWQTCIHILIRAPKYQIKKIHRSLFKKIYFKLIIWQYFKILYVLCMNLINFLLISLSTFRCRRNDLPKSQESCLNQSESSTDLGHYLRWKWTVWTSFAVYEWRQREEQVVQLLQQDDWWPSLWTIEKSETLPMPSRQIQQTARLVVIQIMTTTIDNYLRLQMHNYQSYIILLIAKHYSTSTHPKILKPCFCSVT